MKRHAPMNTNHEVPRSVHLHLPPQHVCGLIQQPHQTLSLHSHLSTAILSQLPPPLIHYAPKPKRMMMATCVVVDMYVFISFYFFFSSNDWSFLFLFSFTYRYLLSVSMPEGWKGVQETMTGGRIRGSNRWLGHKWHMLLFGPQVCFLFFSFLHSLTIHIISTAWHHPSPPMDDNGNTSLHHSKLLLAPKVSGWILCFILVNTNCPCP